MTIYISGCISCLTFITFPHCKVLCWTWSTLVFLTYVLSVLWQFLINLSKWHIWITSLEIRMSHVICLLPFSVKYVHIAGFKVLIAGVMKKWWSLLGSYTMLSGKELTHISKDPLGLLDPEVEGTMNISTSVTIYQRTWCNIPGDLHLHSCHLYKYDIAVAKIGVFFKWILSYFVFIIVFYINF